MKILSSLPFALRSYLRTSLTLLAALVLATASNTSAGQQLVTTAYPGISITTGNPTGTQLSALAFPLAVTTAGVLEVEFTTSPGHCSNMFIRFELDGNTATPAYTSPAPMSANQSTGFINLGPVTPGVHSVAIRAEGVVGGCNNGTLVGWGGSAQVRTSQALISSQSVPTMGWFSVALLAAALGFAAVTALRRRLSV